MLKKVNTCRTVEHMREAEAHPGKRPLTRLEFFRHSGLTWERLLGCRGERVGRSEPTLVLRAGNLIFPSLQGSWPLSGHCFIRSPSLGEEREGGT